MGPGPSQEPVDPGLGQGWQGPKTLSYFPPDTLTRALFEEEQLGLRLTPLMGYQASRESLACFATAVGPILQVLNLTSVPIFLHHQKNPQRIQTNKKHSSHATLLHILLGFYFFIVCMPHLNIRFLRSGTFYLPMASHVVDT